MKKFPLIPANLQHIRENVAKKFPLSHDVMRHTFISMHVAKFRSIGEASIQAGNSESIIRKHYLDLKDAATAEKFFGILPKHAQFDRYTMGDASAAVTKPATPPAAAA